MQQSLNEDHKRALSEFGWLASCSREFREAFLEIGRLEQLDAGAELYRDGEVASNVHGLIRGQVDVHLLAPSGETLVYPFTAPGRWYGLADVVAQMPAYGTAVINEPSWTLRVRGRDLLKFLDEDPNRYQAIVAHEFALRRQVQQAVVDLVTSDSLERVARRLVAMSEFNGTDLSAGVSISQREFAAAAGVSEPTLQRVFRQLKRIGLIGTSYSRVFVKDLKSLRELATNMAE